MVGPRSVSEGPNLEAIAKEAKLKGYFSTEDFPNQRFTRQEFLELMRLLERLGVPLGQPGREVTPRTDLSAETARRIVGALRRGIPAPEGIGHYSIGRDELLQQVRQDLAAVDRRRSIVRFLNADIGQGKTHLLYLLREFAFDRDFAVSIVTLSQNSCPLYDFMAVYRDVMWGLRTEDQRGKPALSNIIDRWIEDIRVYDRDRIRQIVENELPARLRMIMAAYVNATNLFRPNETDRQLVLKFLVGEKMLMRELRRLGISFRIDGENALQILSEMARTIRYIGFKGICILFDEAEAIHSFATSTQRDQAYANLRRIVTESRAFAHCYFIYATTPSFFNAYGSDWLLPGLGQDSLLELQPLTIEEMESIGTRVTNVYALAAGWEPPPEVEKAVQMSATAITGERVGSYVRQTIAILDEARTRA